MVSIEIATAQAAIGELPDPSPTSTNSMSQYPEKEASLVQTNHSYGEGQVTNGMQTFETMRWWHVAVLMIAEVISLGVLALPSATAKLGYAPAVFVISAFGLLATYTGHTIGRFKLAHPSVQSPADAGEVLFGRWGRRILGTASILFLIFVAAAHILSFSIMMNVVTRHGACTVAFGAASAGLSFFCCLGRKLEGVSWFSIISLISIVGAVFITIVGVIKINPHGSSTAVAVAPSVPFEIAMVGVLDIVMAYAGNVAFLGFLSEMRHPAEYPKALYTLQGTATTLYLVVAMSIYAFVGADVKSPALSSASHTIKIVAYCVAIPTIVVAGVINAHVGISMVFRAVRPDMFARRDWESWGWWVFFCALVWLLAWCIAESVPHFDHLIGLMSALLGSWFTYGMSGFLWLFMHKDCWFSSRRNGLLALLNMGLIALAATLCGLGTYACLRAIISAGGTQVWSCADNAR